MNNPLLTLDQEQELIRRWHELGDETALQSLIAAHGRLATDLHKHLVQVPPPLGK